MCLLSPDQKSKKPNYNMFFYLKQKLLLLKLDQQLNVLDMFITNMYTLFNNS